jgi:hypothetical protein
MGGAHDILSDAQYSLGRFVLSSVAQGCVHG